MKQKIALIAPLLALATACSAGSDARATASNTEPELGLKTQADITDKILNALPPEAKTIVDVAKGAASVYSGAKTAIDVATALGVALGMFQNAPTQVDAEIAALSAHLDEMVGALSWQ